MYYAWFTCVGVPLNPIKQKPKKYGIILVEEGKNGAVSFFGDFCGSVVRLYQERVVISRTFSNGTWTDGGK
jgi:hypothetical protein